MNDDLARLLSAATSLDEITARITEAGDRLSAEGNDAVASDLFEVERSLRNANRRLARVVATLR